MSKPPQPKAISDAIMGQCKDLYFRYMSPVTIAKTTGVKLPQIKEWIYGLDGNMKADTWFAERNLVSDQEFLEIRARNRYQSNLAAAEAIDDTINNMKLLRERKNKKGGAVIMSPYELQALTSNILNIQRINQVNELISASKAEADEAPKLINVNQPETIDMEAVAFAMTKDKGILKLISKGGFNGADTKSGRGNETENDDRANEGRQPADKISDDQFGSSKGDDSGNVARAENREADEGAGRASGSGAVIIIGTADRDSGHRDQLSDSEANRKKPARRRVERADASRPETGRTDNQSAGQPDRIAGSDSDGPREFSTVGAGNISDPFEDEYS